MEPGSFQRYIEKHNFVAKEKSSYYVAWVRRFLQMRLSETLSSKDKIAQFIENLALDKKLEQWQIEQGKQAVELFSNRAMLKFKKSLESMVIVNTFLR